MLINISIIVIYLAYESAFLEEFSNVIYFVYSVNMLDIIITSLTGVMNHENQVDYKIFLIWKSYFKSYLWLDLFCALPFDLMLGSTLQKRTMRLLQSFKIFKYFYFMIILNGFLLKIRIKPGTIRIFKIAFNLCSLVQISA